LHTISTRYRGLAPWTYSECDQINTRINFILTTKQKRLKKFFLFGFNAEDFIDKLCPKNTMLRFTTNLRLFTISFQSLTIATTQKRQSQSKLKNNKKQSALYWKRNTTRIKFK